MVTLFEMTGTANLRPRGPGSAAGRRIHPRAELLGLMNIEARVDASGSTTYTTITSHRRWHHSAGCSTTSTRTDASARSSLRALFFLIAHGAAAPFTLAPLARNFDNTDPLDPKQVAEQASLTADVITSGLRINPSGR